MSEREYQRARLGSEVVLTCGAKPEVGYAVNISLGGMYIRMKNPCPIGSTIEVTVSLPPNIQIKTKGVVKRISSHPGEDMPMGVGIRFENLPAESKSRIEDYVRKTSRILKALFFELNRAKINEAKVRELTAQSLIKHQYPLDILREKVASELAGLKLRNEGHVRK